MDQKEIRLTDESINTTVEDLKDFLTSRKVPEKDVLKLGLLIEEALLRLRDKFGREKKATVMTSGFGGARITIKVQGDCFRVCPEPSECRQHIVLIPIPQRMQRVDGQGQQTAQELQDPGRRDHGRCRPCSRRGTAF